MAFSMMYRQAQTKVHCRDYLPLIVCLFGRLFVLVFRRLSILMFVKIMRLSSTIGVVFVGYYYFTYRARRRQSCSTARLKPRARGGHGFVLWSDFKFDSTWRIRF